MGGLSFGLSGFPFWSQDVGGFLGDTYDDLLIRWMQFSVLMSHIRIHGNGNREIYKFNDQCKKICKDYLQLRYRLLPYLWGSSLESCQNGTPITAALAIEFQNDKNVWNIEDQYMSGRFLMVAPIYTRENNRSLYLPSGVWTDWHTGEKIEGGKWFDITADVDILPLYVREGAIIPLGPVMNYVGEKKIDDIELRIYPFACCGESSFNINTGDEIIPVTYKAANGEHTVTVGKTKSKINLCVCGDAEVKLVKE
jgi:alpha-D-xyloside xylohydrolase